MSYDRYAPLDFNDNPPIGRFGDGETPDPWALAPKEDGE
jgi:hypothetical protein